MILHCLDLKERLLLQLRVGKIKYERISFIYQQQYSKELGKAREDTYPAHASSLHPPWSWAFLLPSWSLCVWEPPVILFCYEFCLLFMDLCKLLASIKLCGSKFCSWIVSRSAAVYLFRTCPINFDILRTCTACTVSDFVRQCAADFYNLLTYPLHSSRFIFHTERPYLCFLLEFHCNINNIFTCMEQVAAVWDFCLALWTITHELIYLWQSVPRLWITFYRS